MDALEGYLDALRRDRAGVLFGAPAFCYHRLRAGETFLGIVSPAPRVGID